MTNDETQIGSPLAKPNVYFESLDALRFVCFLSVFLFHNFHTESLLVFNDPRYQFVKYRLFGNGNLAVNFFFVLSGFLITFLLLQEKEVYGRIHIGKFWLRRILRIWPLFYACVFAGFFLFPLLKTLGGEASTEQANLWAYLTFTNNFDFIKNGADASVLNVLWSIAVEEQFYLVWPLIIAFVPTGYYLIVFVSLVLLSIIFRAVFDNALMHEFHTLSCIGDLTIGALGAVWILRYEGRRIVSEWNRITIIAIYCTVMIVFLFRKELFSQFYVLRVIERAFIATLFLAAILHQCYGRMLQFKTGIWKLASQLGRMTYGLYCLHFWGILTATHLTSRLNFDDDLWRVIVVDTAIAFLVTCVLAYVSYRYFEMPFLKLKGKLSLINTSNK